MTDLKGEVGRIKLNAHELPNRSLDRMTRSAGTSLSGFERHWRAPRHRSALR